MNVVGNCMICFREPIIPLNGREGNPLNPREAVIDVCGAVFHRNCFDREFFRTIGYFRCPCCHGTHLKARVWYSLDRVYRLLKNSRFFNWDVATFLGCATASVGLSALTGKRVGLAILSSVLISDLYIVQQFQFVGLNREEIRSTIINFIGCAAVYSSVYPYIKNQFLKGFPIETVLVATLGREFFKYHSEGKREKARQALAVSVQCIISALTRASLANEGTAQLALFLFLAFTVNERFHISHLLPTAKVFFMASVVNTIATGVFL